MMFKRMVIASVLIGMLAPPTMAQTEQLPFLRLQMPHSILFTAQQVGLTIHPTAPEYVTLGDLYSGTLNTSELGDDPAFTVEGALPGGLQLQGQKLSGQFTQLGKFGYSIVGKSPGSPSKSGRTPPASVSVLPAVELGYREIEIIGRVNNPIQPLAATVKGFHGSFSVEAFSGTLPEGISKASDGRLSGSPSSAATGLVTLQAVDSLKRRSVPYTINWQVYGPLQVTSANREIFPGVSVSFAPLVSNAAGKLTTSLSGTLPSGLAFDGATGIISGTPAAGATSASGLRITVADQLGSATSPPFSITVSEAEIVTIDNIRLNLSLRSLFSDTSWYSTKSKVVQLTSGSLVGSTSISTAALLTGSDWGGKLTLIVDGSIQGAGGTTASAKGGDAIRLEKAGLEIINNGEILSGGGAGGGGGKGGQGQALTAWGPWTAWIYTSSYRCESRFSTVFIWGGSNASTTSSTQYECGTLRSDGNTRYYEIRKRDTTVTYTPGGEGGAFGVGRGYLQARSTGANGGSGSNGSGNGGLGGDGGDWGRPGSQGRDGTTGTISGTAGFAGGAAGAAIAGSLSYTLSGGGRIAGSH